MNEIAQLELRLHRSEEQWADSFLVAALFKDDETPQHIQRMSRYAEVIVQTTAQDREHARMVRLASQLHDIGKLGIPDEILLKMGTLTPSEVAVMRRHTVIGHGILANIGDSEIARLASATALSHHERWDGHGYPHGLRGEDIPEVARVAAIADAFDALSTNRIYRKAYSVPKALDLMRAERGRQFDPELLDGFFAAIDQVMDIFKAHPD